MTANWTFLASCSCYWCAHKPHHLVAILHIMVSVYNHMQSCSHSHSLSLTQFIQNDTEFLQHQFHFGNKHQTIQNSTFQGELQWKRILKAILSIQLIPIIFKLHSFPQQIIQTWVQGQLGILGYDVPAQTVPTQNSRAKESWEEVIAIKPIYIWHGMSHPQHSLSLHPLVKL